MKYIQKITFINAIIKNLHALAMKINEKLIEEMVVEIAGKEGLTIYKILKNRENVNEFDIAKKLKLTINQIRNLIYKFEKYNLVASIRKKDRKKGWYIYFFTFNKKEAEKLVVKFKEEKVKKLERIIDIESEHEFYTCPNQCIRTTLENAMENNFMCPECNSLLQPEKREKNIQKIKKQTEDLKEELKRIKS